MNTILWENSAPGNPAICQEGGLLTITYSDIEGGWSGIGNIDTNPIFRNPENNDFHLSAADCGNLSDSPCIDAGDPDLNDLFLECDWGLGAVRSDMGAFGGVFPMFDVYVDIKPNACPNRIKTGKPDFSVKGVIPVAILGEEDFDVYKIDPSTITLAGISPLRWSFEDVSTPVYDPITVCECTEDGPDGFIDLALKFDKSRLIEALGQINSGDEITLSLHGLLINGRHILGTDCVVIVGMKNIGPKAGSIEGMLCLNRVYPNPFNSSTKIEYSLPETRKVRIEIYDLLGRKIAILLNESKQAGYHQVVWDASGHSSGVYFYRIEAGDFIETRKMILLK
jgi:hypothetical protein